MGFYFRSAATSADAATARNDTAENGLVALLALLLVLAACDRSPKPDSATRERQARIDEAFARGVVTPAPTPINPRAEATARAVTAAKEKARIAAREAACKGIDYSTIRGTLIQRVANESRDFYVTLAWYGMTLDRKQAVARYLYTCRSGEHPIHVYDSRTGKKLAAYDSGWGYSNYED